jgi:hypothetical protein
MTSRRQLLILIKGVKKMDNMEDKEPYAYEYTNCFGDVIITRACGSNTYIGKEASNLMFIMMRRMWNLEFTEKEFNNYLIMELNKREDWGKTNNFVKKEYSDGMDYYRSNECAMHANDCEGY